MWVQLTAYTPGSNGAPGQWSWTTAYQNPNGSFTVGGGPSGGPGNMPVYDPNDTYGVSGSLVANNLSPGSIVWVVPGPGNTYYLVKAITTGALAPGSAGFTGTKFVCEQDGFIYVWTYFNGKLLSRVKTNQQSPYCPCPASVGGACSCAATSALCPPPAKWPCQWTLTYNGTNFLLSQTGSPDTWATPGSAAILWVLQYQPGSNGVSNGSVTATAIALNGHQTVYRASSANWICCGQNSLGLASYRYPGVPRYIQVAPVLVNGQCPCTEDASDNCTCATSSVACPAPATWPCVWALNYSTSKFLLYQSAVDKWDTLPGSQLQWTLQYYPSSQLFCATSTNLAAPYCQPLNMPWNCCGVNTLPIVGLSPPGQPSSLTVTPDYLCPCSAGAQLPPCVCATSSTCCPDTLWPCQWQFVYNDVTYTLNQTGPDQWESPGGSPIQWNLVAGADCVYTLSAYIASIPGTINFVNNFTWGCCVNNTMYYRGGPPPSGVQNPVVLTPVQPCTCSAPGICATGCLFYSLYSTGQDPFGDLLADQASDPHWTCQNKCTSTNPSMPCNNGIVSGTFDCSDNSTNPAVVVYGSSEPPFAPPDPQWGAQVDNSRWVARYKGGWSSTTSDANCVGPFLFTTTFGICKGANLLNLSLMANVMADDGANADIDGFVDVILNGREIITQQAVSFKQYTLFNISGNFQEGYNVLQFRVQNQDAPYMGLRVAFYNPCSPSGNCRCNGSNPNGVTYKQWPCVWQFVYDGKMYYLMQSGNKSHWVGFHNADIFWTLTVFSGTSAQLIGIGNTATNSSVVEYQLSQTEPVAWSGCGPNYLQLTSGAGLQQTVQLTASTASGGCNCGQGGSGGGGGGGGGTPNIARPSPGLLKRAANFTGAVAKEAAAIVGGQPAVTEGQYQERVSICRGCPLFDGSRCTACGCPVEGEVVSAARFRSKKCPKGKWPELGTESAPAD